MAKTFSLNETDRQVLQALREHSESDAPTDGWRTVYLDNAHPDDMTANQFRARLARLSQAGLYKPIDSFCFGDVKMTD